MTAAVAERCPVCGAAGLLALPSPGGRGMLSDGRLLGWTPQRRHCRRCGCASLLPRLAGRLPRRLYGAGYQLNGRPPTPFDEARQAAYARRIAALWPAAPPASVLDVGCGNGALLRALGRLWPAARLAGVEPAPAAAAGARAAGLPVRAALRPGQRAALVVSVNVLEHTDDPLGFLRALRRSVAPGGRAVLLCPDGDTPWIELLVGDHRFSFSQAGLALLAARAGFRVLRAEGMRGGPQAVLLQPGPVRRSPPRGCRSAAPRRRYLARWRRLDHALAPRLPATGPLIGFGCGETAQLLRGYAPRLWARLTGLTADHAARAPGSPRVLGKPWIAREAATPSPAMLLLVAPPAQAAVAAALAGRPDGRAPLRWDDLIPR